MTLKKDEYIAKYGEEAYEKHLEQSQEWYRQHCERAKATVQKRRVEKPEIVKANNREISRKGGKYYEAKRVYDRSGLQGKKNKIRKEHAYKYRPYKMIIAPDSELHHQWCPQSAEYTGVALVEANPHRYGIIDVIQILDGKITLLTEEAIRNQEPAEEMEGVK